jgi:hypothetical protein
MERVQPGMTLSNLAAGQPHPNRAIQPAGSIDESHQERLAQQEALATRGHCPKPQFPSLIPTVQDYPPPECRAVVLVPIQHSDELFA